MKDIEVYNEYQIMKGQSKTLSYFDGTPEDQFEDSIEWKMNYQKEKLFLESLYEKELFKGILFLNRELKENDYRVIVKPGLIYLEKLERGNDKPSKNHEPLFAKSPLASGQAPSTPSSPSKSDYPIGAINLGFQRLEVVSFRSEIRHENLISVTLSTKESFTRLITASTSEAEKLRKALAPFVVNKDFKTRYEIREAIGSGGFSQVHKVYNKQVNKYFAAKIIKHRMIQSDPNGAALLRQEISLMRQLDHPHIIRLIETYEAVNAVIIVMELVEGKELKSSSLKRMLSFDAIKAIMGALLSVIQYLGEKGYVHRDLKPNNIMIAPNNGTITSDSVKIIDYGMAASKEGPLILKKCGTPGYIAPEVFKYGSDSKYTVKTALDVYSAGIIFYQLLFGENPFRPAKLTNYGTKDVIALNSKNQVGVFEAIPVPNLKGQVTNEMRSLILSMVNTRYKARPSPKDLLNHHLFRKEPKIDLKSQDSGVAVSNRGTLESLDNGGCEGHINRIYYFRLPRAGLFPSKHPVLNVSAQPSCAQTPEMRVFPPNETSKPLVTQNTGLSTCRNSSKSPLVTHKKTLSFSSVGKFSSLLGNTFREVDQSELRSSMFVLDHKLHPDMSYGSSLPMFSEQDASNNSSICQNSRLLREEEQSGDSSSPYKQRAQSPGLLSPFLQSPQHKPIQSGFSRFAPSSLQKE